MLGVGGLGNVLTVKASFSRYFPSETVVPNVFAPAPAPFADTELMPTIKEFKFEVRFFLYPFYTKFENESFRAFF